MKRQKSIFLSLLAIFCACLFLLTGCFEEKKSSQDTPHEIKVTYCNQAEEGAVFYEFYETDKSKAEYRCEIGYSEDGIAISGEIRNQKDNALVCKLVFTKDGVLESLSDFRSLEFGLVEVYVFTYDANNKISSVTATMDKEIVGNGEAEDYSREYKYAYNEHGNLSEISCFGYGETIVVKECTYYEDQRLKNETIRDGHGYSKSITYFYDADGKIEKTQTSLTGTETTNDEPIYDTLYEYQGEVLLKKTSYGAKRNQVLFVEEFDALGNCTKYVEYDYGAFPGGDPDRIVYEKPMEYRKEYQYDSHGNRVQAIEYTFHGDRNEVIRHIEENMEYDEDHNMVKYEVAYDHILYLSIQYTYNQENECVKSLVLNKDGQNMEEYEGYIHARASVYTPRKTYSILFYNKNGQLIKNTTRNIDGTLFSYKSYEYYENGRKHIITNYDENGSVESSKEYPQTGILYE